MRFSTDDTIVATSSPPGWGPRGIVRISGPDAVRIAAGLFQPDRQGPLDAAPGFRRIVGRVCFGEGNHLPAECYVFRAPRSYTRQDCLELHTLGSPPLLAMILDRAVADGARLAEPGEFTARAVLLGAMDLSQAEAVAALIAARTDAELRAGRRLKEGELARRTASLADQLVELAALVEADIDFSEEPIEFITPGLLRSRLEALLAEVGELLEESRGRERLAVRPTVLLVGAPNAGKSTLLNALTGVDRAICSAVAGTTRDVLSAPLTLRTGDVVLLDGPGRDEHFTTRDDSDAREDAGSRSGGAAVPNAPIKNPFPLGEEGRMSGKCAAISPSPDPSLERRGIAAGAVSPQPSALNPQHSALSTQSSVLSPQSSALGTQHPAPNPPEAGRVRVEAAAQRADLICLVVDVSKPVELTDSLPTGAGRRRPDLVVANKVDLIDSETIRRRTAALADVGLGTVYPVSALRGIGLPGLRDGLAALFAATAGAIDDSALVLTLRQRDSLQAGLAALERALALARVVVDTGDMADLIAVELREALEAVRGVGGSVCADDLLGRVFSSFCIGK